MSKPTGPRYTDLIASLPSTVPFVGPETQERARGRLFQARLGANENVFGPSPNAIAALRSADAELWKYGDAHSYDLKCALAAHHGVETDAIIVGEGIDGLLGNLVRLLIGVSDPVVTSNGAYPTFNYHVAGFGGQLHTVPYKNDFEDPVALIAKGIEVGAKLIYLANPDNPMGTVHDASVIQAAIDAVPDGSLLILDEAYVEFAPEHSVPAFETSNPNVVRMRTFSKAYGLAGARVGYAIGHPELIDNFNKIRNHFGVNRSAQMGALAALQDQAYLTDIVAKIAASRDRIGEIAKANGLRAIVSATNFVSIDCGHDGVFAKALVDALIARDVFVRMPFVAPQNRCIRVSAGGPQDLDVFEAVLPEALKAIK